MHSKISVRILICRDTEVGSNPADSDSVAVGISASLNLTTWNLEFMRWWLSLVKDAGMRFLSPQGVTSQVQILSTALMVKVEPYDGFRVSCDCGETFYVHSGWNRDEIDCGNQDFNRSFSINIEVDDEGETSFGELPA